MRIARYTCMTAIALAAALLESDQRTRASEPAAGAATAIVVGQPFPPLVLPDAATGRARSIAEFRGRKLILHIFASW